MSDYTFRGGYIEDSSGDRWWSSELLSKVERERDEARDNNARLRELADIAAGEQGLAQRRMLEAQEQRNKAVREVTFLKDHYSDVVRRASELRSEFTALRAENERLQRLLDHATQDNPGTSVLVMLINESKELREELDGLRRSILDASVLRATCEKHAVGAEFRVHLRETEWDGIARKAGRK